MKITCFMSIQVLFCLLCQYPASHFVYSMVYFFFMLQVADDSQGSGSLVNGPSQAIQIPTATKPSRAGGDSGDASPLTPVLSRLVRIVEMLNTFNSTQKKHTVQCLSIEQH